MPPPDLALAEHQVGSFLADTAEPEAGPGALPPELPGLPPVEAATEAAGQPGAEPMWDPEAFAEAAVRAARERTSYTAGKSRVACAAALLLRAGRGRHGVWSCHCWTAG